MLPTSDIGDHVSEVIAAGNGRVVYQRVYHDDGRHSFTFNPDSIEVIDVQSPAIWVYASGAVLYEHKLRDPQTGESAGAQLVFTPKADVFFADVEVSPAMSSPQVEAECGVCQDDDTVVKSMMPPVCPRCHRGAPRR